MNVYSSSHHHEFYCMKIVFKSCNFLLRVGFWCLGLWRGGLAWSGKGWSVAVLGITTTTPTGSASSGNYQIKLSISESTATGVYTLLYVCTSSANSRVTVWS